MTGPDAFQLAQQAEELAGQLYRQLLTFFAPGSDAHRRFSGLAAEEDQHALRLQMLRARCLQHPHTLREVQLDAAAMRTLVAEAETLRELFGRPGIRVSAAEARELMLALERRFAGAHAHAAISPANGELRAFFEELARQDREHMRLLEELRVADGR